MKKNSKRTSKILAPIMGLAILAPSIFPSMAAAADNDLKVKSVEFIGMSAPSTVQEMASLYTNASLQLHIRMVPYVLFLLLIKGFLNQIKL